MVRLLFFQAPGLAPTVLLGEVQDLPLSFHEGGSQNVEAVGTPGICEDCRGSGGSGGIILRNTLTRGSSIGRL